jgi:hypothetical protein
MAGFNVPSFDTNNISVGPGILFIGSSGNTPTVDVGAVRNGELAITRERLDIEQGWPAQLITRYSPRETVTLTVTSIEWNFDNLRDALGAGEPTGAAPGTQFDFGGDVNFRNVSVKYQHRLAPGGTVEINIWTANGSGEITTTFGDDVHEFPYALTALNSTTNWASEVLGDTAALFQITRE